MNNGFARTEVIQSFYNPNDTDLEAVYAFTGEDKTYATSFVFPDTDTENPELERLWAMNRIEAIEAVRLVGTMPPSEAEEAIEDLGVAYQLVTDETSIVVPSDEGFLGPSRSRPSVNA